MCSLAVSMDVRPIHGNGVIGILREAKYKWERRCLLTPSHAARLLRAGLHNGGVSRIVVQPSEKRIYRDNQYEEVGCEISDNLEECGTIFGVKQPPVGSLLAGRSYVFFSHTHKAQPENMALLDEALQKRTRLYDYELIVNDQGNRLVAFGEFAGRAGMIDFLRGLGERYLALGYSTPFLNLGSAYMYPSLAAAKAAVLAVGEEIASVGLPATICPITFVFTGTGNVSRGAQEVFRLLPHRYVDPADLPTLADTTRGDTAQYQVYATVAESQHMVAPNDPTAPFLKAEYYARPENFHPIFHETLAPYATAVINCMYWERRFPRLLTRPQLRALALKPGGLKLLGIADITCDVEGSVECLVRSTDIEKPFFRYDPLSDSCHDEMDGPGLFLLGVDILPTELAREATKHFGDALFPFVGALAAATDVLCRASPGAESLEASAKAAAVPEPMRRACIAADGKLTPLFEYITRMREKHAERQPTVRKAGESTEPERFSTVISLAGHLFDQFLINEALDVIETAGGRFSVASCHVGQSSRATSSAEIHVAADTAEQLATVVEALAEIAGVFFPKLPPAVSALTRTGTIEKARARQRSWDALHAAARRSESLSPTPRGGFAGFKTERVNGGVNGGVDEKGLECAGVNNGGVNGGTKRERVGFGENYNKDNTERMGYTGVESNRGTNFTRLTNDAIDPYQPVGSLVPSDDSKTVNGIGCKSGSTQQNNGTLATTKSGANKNGGRPRVLLLGAGRMCEPAVRYLTAGCPEEVPGLNEGNTKPSANYPGIPGEAPGLNSGDQRPLAEHPGSLLDAPGLSEGDRRPRAERPGIGEGATGATQAPDNQSGAVEHWTGAHVTVASLFLEEAQRVAACGGDTCQAVQLDTRDTEALRKLVSETDVVISLLPPGCHVAVARACIEQRKDLATASYVSEEMQALEEAARAAGVTLLCEMGLDPGIDHMSAMKLIDGIHSKGGRVRSFVSSCGGLPAPTAADNPLGYKFSWNPRGAILAGRNAATYKQDGKTVSVAGPDLFASATPCALPQLPAFALERLPNRDSLLYGPLYGIADEADTIFRATLRYKGFSTIMDCFGRAGLFDDAPLPALPRPATCLSFAATWLRIDGQHGTAAGVHEQAVLAALKSRMDAEGGDPAAVARAVEVARWLGLTSSAPLPDAVGSPLDLLCHRMETMMGYQPGEQDLILLHHELLEETADGRCKRHTATLVATGESASRRNGGHPETAMAKTVGLPVAIGAQLLLQRRVEKRGVLRPLTPDIYGPALKELERLGVSVKESVVDVLQT